MGGVTLMSGTPEEPFEYAALVLKLWRPQKKSTTPERGLKHGHSMASIHIVKPGRAGYVVEQLVPRAEVLPHTILSCVASIAHLMGVSTVYVNADLKGLPAPPSVLDEHTLKPPVDDDVLPNQAYP